jgi:cytidylate kinase
MKRVLVIAVDGTAASGKGTLARRLARHFGFAYLDTGALYRQTALGVLRAGGDPANEKDALDAAMTIDPLRVDAAALRDAQVAQAASVVAAIPSVRQALLAFQRRFAADPPGGARGAVIDGRDIGTVVCPQADAKLFVDASVEVRAHRRWLEFRQAGDLIPEATVVADIRKRDARDRGRAVAPLKPAPDARLLDTSDLDIDAAFAAALGLVEPGIGEALRVTATGVEGDPAVRR